MSPDVVSSIKMYVERRGEENRETETETETEKREEETNKVSIYIIRDPPNIGV